MGDRGCVTGKEGGVNGCVYPVCELGVCALKQQLVDRSRFGSGEGM
jgi:hypothetical protein